MKVGVGFSKEWKDKSIEKELPVADLLYGYVVEKFLVKIEESNLYNDLLLQNVQAVGKIAYRKKAKDRLTFYYLVDKKRLSSQDIISEIVKSSDEIEWSYEVEDLTKGFCLHLQAIYMEMKTPLTVQFEELEKRPKFTKKIEWQQIFSEKKTVSCLSCSKEQILSENIFQMMKMLELIADMGVYATINDIIKTEIINGRYIMDELLIILDSDKKIISSKRLEQIASYKDYTYMKKRWQQYIKTHNVSDEEWSVVLGRILSFVGPIWTALCNDEIFFDDWMPELERFLG